jgi:hypothetical protein
MGKVNYWGKAQRYAEKIRRLNDYGHETGYEQAQRYFWLLGDLMKSATDHNSSDVPLIHSIYADMKKIIDEWEEER